MTVQQLIDLLSEFDPSTHVYLPDLIPIDGLTLRQATHHVAPWVEIECKMPDREWDYL